MKKTKTRCVVLVCAMAISLLLNVVGVWCGGRLFCIQLEAERAVEKVVEKVKCDDSGLMNSDLNLKYADVRTRVYSGGEGNSTNILYYKASGTNEYYLLGCENNMSQGGKGHKTRMSFISDDMFALWQYGETGQCERILLHCKSKPYIFDELGDGKVKCSDKMIESKIRSSSGFCVEN